AVPGPADPRVALYWPWLPGGEARQRQLRQEIVATRGCDAGCCRVDVHYSWDCLRRLCQAREEAGKTIYVDSVVVPEDAPEELLRLAWTSSPKVYSVGKKLMVKHVCAEGSGRNSCMFTTIFPVSRPLAALRAPVIVLEDAESASVVGQILRTAYHFGVDSAVVSESVWDMLGGRACRVSMGWAYHLDFHVALSMPTALRGLRARGVELFAVAPARGPCAAGPRAAHRGGWGLVVGRGGAPSAAALAQCGGRVPVALRREGGLAAAQAAALGLYELGARGVEVREADASIGEHEPRPFMVARGPSESGGDRFMLECTGTHVG
ncbi:unnamed protein product, partial [Prorocentrum cordatum]